MTNVDWSRPIEAVHVDGRVCAAKVSRFSATGDSVLVRYSDYEDETEWYDTRLPGHSRTGWHIRNVQTPEAENPAIDPALVERMVALVRKVAASDLSGTLQDAHFILKALEPVDCDLLEAREIAANLYGCSSGTIQDYRNGRYDTNSEVVNIKAGLKRGRELERERGEAK